MGAGAGSGSGSVTFPQVSANRSRGHADDVLRASLDCMLVCDMMTKYCVTTPEGLADLREHSLTLSSCLIMFCRVIYLILLHPNSSYSTKLYLRISFATLSYPLLITLAFFSHQHTHRHISHTATAATTTTTITATSVQVTPIALPVKEKSKRSFWGPTLRSSKEKDKDKDKDKDIQTSRNGETSQVPSNAKSSADMHQQVLTIALK
jgi:hypothetical protein